MQDRWTWKRERNIPRPALAGNTLSGRRYLIYLCIERIVRWLVGREKIRKTGEARARVVARAMSFARPSRCRDLNPDQMDLIHRIEGEMN